MTGPALQKFQNNLIGSWDRYKNADNNANNFSFEDFVAYNENNFGIDLSKKQEKGLKTYYDQIFTSGGLTPRNSLLAESYNKPGDPIVIKPELESAFKDLHAFMEAEQAKSKPLPEGGQYDGLRRIGDAH